MGFWDIVDKVVGPAREQTASDDARSRLARRDYEERNRLKRVEYDDQGDEQLWFTVALTVGDHSGVPIAWAGQDVDEVNAAVAEWLRASEFITVDFEENGKKSKLTFRASFVPHWTVDERGRKRP